MAKTFNEKVEAFINCNELFVGRIYTINNWFALQGALSFDEDKLNELVIPEGLHIEVDQMDDYSERIVYFIVDENGIYEELIPTGVFWKKYAEDLKQVKTKDEAYAS